MPWCLGAMQQVLMLRQSSVCAAQCRAGAADSGARASSQQRRKNARRLLRQRCSAYNECVTEKFAYTRAARRSMSRCPRRKRVTADVPAQNSYGRRGQYGRGQAAARAPAVCARKSVVSDYMTNFPLSRHPPASAARVRVRADAEAYA